MPFIIQTLIPLLFAVLLQAGALFLCARLFSLSVKAPHIFAFAVLSTFVVFRLRAVTANSEMLSSAIAASMLSLAIQAIAGSLFFRYAPGGSRLPILRGAALSASSFAMLLGFAVSVFWGLGQLTP